MEDVNLSFLLYFVDVKPPLEVKEHLERALRFSMRMEEADVPLDERQNSFEGDLFGMSVLLRFAYDWPEEKSTDSQERRTSMSTPLPGRTCSSMRMLRGSLIVQASKT